MRSLAKLSLIAVLASAFANTAMGGDHILINGAGATFPFPLYSKWFAEYEKVDASVRINYQSIGSGGGIRQLTEKTVDFGASDAPMTDEQLSKAPAPILHVPTVLGAVVVTFNLPGVQTLKLTPETIAGIFLGKITQWNDQHLASLNPDAKLPKTSILVVHRSDGSGTTGIFTDYLSKVSPDWKSKVGAGTAVNWPVGLGGKGNEGVTGLVKQTPGSIGYVEHLYAENNKLAYATLKNRAGTFVTASTQSVTAAAQGALTSIPDDLRVSITDADGKDAYPISGFTYLLVFQTMPQDKGERLVKFLRWAIADGQRFAEPLTYATLPPEVVKKAQAKIESIKLTGKATH